MEAAEHDCGDGGKQAILTDAQARQGSGNAASKLNLEAAFDTVWQQHSGRLFRLVARLAGSIDDADDLLQDVRLKAYAGFPKYRRSAAPYTWLYRIAVNVVLRSRERKRISMIALDAPAAINSAAQTAGPEHAAIEAELQLAVRRAIESLPDELRVTLILQSYEGLKYREIAEVLGVPLGTVKSRINAAVLRLREELKDYADA